MSMEVENPMVRPLPIEPRDILLKTCAGCNKPILPSEEVLETGSGDYIHDERECMIKYMGAREAT